MNAGVPTLISVVQNDYGYSINFTLNDSFGVVVDLTGATLEFKAQLVSNSGVQVSGAMNVISPTLGTCKYVVNQGDFGVSGTYNAQVMVTYSPNEILSFDGIGVTVAHEVPIS